MNLLLHKVAVVDTLLGTRNDILESNVKYYMWMQLISLASILVIVYANFVSTYSDFNIGVCATATYVCTTIRSVTIMEFLNLISLLK